MKRIDVLDGFRGLAAFWVLLGHTMYLTGFNVPILSSPGKGVDLFIMLSGFLMFHLYGIGKDIDRTSSRNYWESFLIKRFFRLSPLYYTLLAVSFLSGPAIYEDRVVIESVVNITPQLSDRYTDVSLQNIFLHLTYLFGIFSDYTSRTALPDWSIGLEAQFYYIFPLLVLLGTKFGWLVVIPLTVALSFIAGSVVHGRFFQNLSEVFIVYQLNLFLVGAMMAFSLRAKSRGKWLYFSIAMIVLLLHRFSIGDTRPPSLFVLIAIVFIFFVGINYPTFSILKPLIRVAGGNVAFWMGELSYSVYLIHLLILHPVAAYVIEITGPDFSPALRFALVFPPVLLLTYAVSFLTHKFIELPGQAIGQKVVAMRTASTHES